MGRLLVPALVLAALAWPATASADHHLMQVNEVMLSSGGNATAQFVELVDPVDEPFPAALQPYRLVVFDGNGARLGGQDLSNLAAVDAAEPYLIASDAAGLGAARDAPLAMSLPQGAGQVCFTRQAAEVKVNCVSYGCPASRPAPADGQSLQRTSAGFSLGSPTPNAPNAAGTPAACDGGGVSQPGGGGETGDPGGGGDTAGDIKAPTVKLGGRARQDVDKLAIRVELSEAATLTVRGRVSVPRSRAAATFRLMSVRREVRAGQRVTVRLKLSRRGRAAVKAALRRGLRVRARVKVSARDAAGNEVTRRRAVRLTD